MDKLLELAAYSMIFVRLLLNPVLRYRRSMGVIVIFISPRYEQGQAGGAGKHRGPGSFGFSV